MLRAIVGASLKYRFLLLFAAALMFLFGASQLAEMPVDVFPEFAPPRIEIQTEAKGLSTEEVEGLITGPIEAALEGTSSLHILRSKSVPGLSSVLMIFALDTDLIAARALVHERLSAVRPLLPNVARPPVMLPPLSATSRALKIGISSQSMSLVALSELVRWKIRPRLMKVNGVANVATWGQRKKQLQVQVDPRRLSVVGVSLDEVVDATSEALDVGLLAYRSGARTGTGGFIDAADRRFQVRFVTDVLTAEELAQVTFRAQNGQNLRIGDVATVAEDHPPMIGDAIINDGPGILLIVEKFPWANTLEVTEDVEHALALLRPGLEGVEVDATIFRPASFIEVAIRNLTLSLISGAILVVVVLLLFLLEWRATLISLVAIPLSLMAAVVVFYLSGTTMNTMVLAGFVIALGAVVDDAIIDIENTVRRLRENRLHANPLSKFSVVREASIEIRNSITYATLIIILAVAPVILMEGLSGAFFRPLALAYALALAASMVVALTVTPALSFIMLSDAALKKPLSPLVTWLQSHYEQKLARINKTPMAVLFATGIVAASSLLALPFLGQSLLPDFKERDFLMHWVTKPGTSLPEMDRITTRVSRELRSIPGVRNFGAHVGRAVAGDEVVGVNFTENWISVEPTADYKRTVSAIEDVVKGYPGLYRDVQTYLKERIREVLTGTSEAVVIRIFGPDLGVLRKMAAQARDVMQGVSGITDLHIELQEDVPHIAVEVDLERAQKSGLKPGDVRRSMATLIAGIEVSDIYLGAALYDVVVIGTRDTQYSINSLRELLIDTPGGGHVRLADIADVTIKPTPNVIRREAGSRRIDVAANVKGRDLGAAVGDIQERLGQITFPQEYHAEIIGEYAERSATRNRLLGLTVVAAIGIFILLHAALGSLRLAALAFLSLPMALAGGVLAAFVGGGVISLGSMVGFLTVLGITARNGILLLSHCQHLIAFEGEVFGPELVLRGARERLSPILMTTLATGLALVPLVVLGNLPGHEIEYPMAIVILGGLVTATLLNLFVVPVLYLRYGNPHTGVLNPVRGAIPVPNSALPGK